MSLKNRFVYYYNNVEKENNIILIPYLLGTLPSWICKIIEKYLNAKSFLSFFHLLYITLQLKSKRINS